MALAAGLLTAGVRVRRADRRPPRPRTAAAAVPVIDPVTAATTSPQLDPADFVAVIDNPYLPAHRRLALGLRGRERRRARGRSWWRSRTRPRQIEGITAVVVRDTVHVDGVLVEDTYDWFAQDRDGNVWYLGEDSSDFDEDGDLVSKEGSWEYGQDGALPGIVMPADPQPGDAYRQEYLPGVAEDMGEVLRDRARARRSASARYEDVVVTEDWTPLEPEVIENKWYAPGVGMIYGTHETGRHGRPRARRVHPRRRESGPVQARGSTIPGAERREETTCIDGPSCIVAGVGVVGFVADRDRHRHRGRERRRRHGHADHRRRPGPGVGGGARPHRRRRGHRHGGRGRGELLRGGGHARRRHARSTCSSTSRSRWSATRPTRTTATDD